MLFRQNQSPGILCRDQRKVSHGTSDGKQDLDASPLACSNVIAQPPATISAGVAMSGHIQFRSLAISKNNEESNIDNSIIVGRASISQAALILFLTPVGALGLDPSPLASRPLSIRGHSWAEPSCPARKPNLGAQIRMPSYSPRSWHSLDAIFPRGFI